MPSFPNLRNWPPTVWVVGSQLLESLNHAHMGFVPCAAPCLAPDTELSVPFYPDCPKKQKVSLWTALCHTSEAEEDIKFIARKKMINGGGQYSDTVFQTKVCAKVLPFFPLQRNRKL